MSNNNDEYDDGLGPDYWSRLKDAREENERKIKEAKAFDDADGPKPSHLRPEPLSEQELHQQVKDQGAQEAERQQYLKDAGFVDKDGKDSAQSPERAGPEHEKPSDQQDKGDDFWAGVEKDRDRKRGHER